MERQTEQLLPSAGPSVRGYRWLLPLGLSLFLLLVSAQNYLLFHTLIELFSVLVALLAAMVVWQSPLAQNHFLTYLGCGYFAVAGMDLLHLLGYKGMGVFVDLGTDVPTQFWLAGRYLEALLLLTAPRFLSQSINRYYALAFYGLLALLFGLLIFAGYFPVAYVDGEGLTDFKVWSEYLIIAMLLLAQLQFWRKRQQIDPLMLRLLNGALVFTIAAELCFTLYVGVYGVANILGHLFKFFSFWCVFEAAVLLNLKEPIRLLNDDLQREIRERSYAEQGYRFAEENFSLLLNSTAEAIYGIDQDGNCTFVNNAFLELMGYESVKPLIGSNIHLLIHHTYANDLTYPLKDCRIYRAVQRGEGLHADDEVFWRSDGSCFLAEYWAYPMLRDGVVIGAVVTFFDITEKKRAEREREQLLYNMDKRVKELRCMFAVTQVLRDFRTLESIFREVVKVIPSGLRYPEAAVARIQFAEREFVSAPLVASEWKLSSDLRVEGEWRGVLEVYYPGQFAEVDEEQPFLVEEHSLLDSIASSLAEAVERKLAEKRLKQLATRDGMTGLFNRSVLEQRLIDEVARAARYRLQLSLFMLDIDHFKSINDTYGHRAGDEAIRGVARLLEGTIRKTDYAGRFGGEEFVIILPETSMAKAEEMAKRLLWRIAEHRFPIPGGKILQLTVSIGVAHFNVPQQHWSQLLEAADQAMYRAKQSGRNQVQLDISSEGDAQESSSA